MLKRLAVASAALVALLAGPLAAGRALAAQDLAAMTNAERVSRGLRALSTASDLQSLAQLRANQMAQSGVLAHTVNLSSKVSGWQKIGENVGRGPALSDIETAFMNSPEHRTNILDPAFTQVGVGVTWDGGRYFWVAVIFRQPTGAAAARAPVPVPKVAAAPKPPRPAATTTTRPPITTTTVPPTTTTTAPPPPPTTTTTEPPTTTTTTTAPRPIYANPDFLAANFGGEMAAPPLRPAAPRPLPAAPVTVAFAGVVGVGTATGATALRVRRLRLPKA